MSRGRKSIESVLEAHTDALMSLPGVVGTAISKCAGQECIKVFVVKKDPNLLSKIPAKIDGFPVIVQETGELRALEPY